jgi:dUTP pyrophosphatase
LCAENILIPTSTLVALCDRQTQHVPKSIITQQSIEPICMLLSAARKSAIVSFHKAALSTLALATKMDTLRVKLLSEHATMPTKGSPLSAGFDLSASEAITIPANGGRALVKTDISIACPIGTYARIAPRSGLAWKNGIDVGAGVVDADYRGPVGVILFNFGKEDFEVTKGDRIAQLILEKICMAEAVLMEDLDDTKRGSAGFGSTGVQDKRARTISANNSSDDENIAEDASDEKGTYAEQE